MSTRANVHVVSNGLSWKEGPIQLYHHYDGYPSNMLVLFAKAFESGNGSWELGRAGKAAGFICASDPGQFEPEVDNGALHGDIEYFYRITCKNSANGTMAEQPTWLIDVFTSHDAPQREQFWKDGNPKHLRLLIEGLSVSDCAARAEEVEALG